MTSFAEVKELTVQGRYSDALSRLNQGPIAPAERIDAEVVRAELFERTGKCAHSRRLVESLLRSKELSPQQLSACESVAGRLAWFDGNAEAANLHMQRSASIAREAGDWEGFCWTQLRLLLMVADLVRPEASAPMCAELRWQINRLGHPQLIAALHIFVSQLEARRGLARSASRHVGLGRQALLAMPNIWLEAIAETTDISVSLLEADVETAFSHAQRCLHLAEESGAVGMVTASLSNLGQISCWLGHLDEAARYHERALDISIGGPDAIAIHGNLAEVRLSQGRIEECATILDAIEQIVQQPSDRASHAYRHSLAIRAECERRQRQFAKALETTAAVSGYASNSGDQFLAAMASLTRAQILAEAGASADFLSTLNGLLVPVGKPLYLLAQYERTLASALASTEDIDGAVAHFWRSKRLYENLQNAPGLAELARCWRPADRKKAESSGLTDVPHKRARTTVQSASLMPLYARRPELLAQEIISLLRDTECVERAAACVRSDKGTEIVICATGEAGRHTETIEMGISSKGVVEIRLEPKADVESIATLNAIKLNVLTIRELESARVEREERLTLWPIDDVPLEDGQAVVGGQMRELMIFARRIASTSVSVLITGESGTGKEILARAIHNYSIRAKKPFVPFNCTAVPRDLIESQLFGHRRGAFTGAERDQPGLIRSAKEGTLFLDEIGELGLDLQPKLLRFLESGEINPLGEPSPFAVDVRIIAATNTKLEDAVRNGRFREDLFYRLNVIRLRIPPLRERRDEIPALVNHFVGRAAEEFQKGQIRLAEETMECLLVHRWPGNIRQLQNELRRMIALADRDAVLSPAALSDDIRHARPAADRRANGGEIAVPLRDKLAATLSKIEREMVKAALRDHHGRLDDAARALGISRKGLYLKRQRLGL